MTLESEESGCKHSPDFLPKDDLSWFLKTQKLMEAWYVLPNENASVILGSISTGLSAES